MRRQSHRAAVSAVSGCAVGVAVLLAAWAHVDAAQTRDAKKPARPEVITLSGCVVRGESTPGQYTLTDPDGVTYRLTGMDIRDYIGRRVEIVGGTPRRKLTIKGGLVPNPNVAAQGSSIDPSRAAVAAQGGSAGPGNVELPEFRVKSVRPVSGSCPG